MDWGTHMWVESSHPAEIESGDQNLPKNVKKYLPEEKSRGIMIFNHFWQPSWTPSWIVENASGGEAPTQQKFKVETKYY